jgi:hypothetical protein
LKKTIYQHIQNYEFMKKWLLILLFLIPLSIIRGQDVIVPTEGSGKWIEGNEMYITVVDSVRVKFNYLETAVDMWVFEIEFLNMSTTKEVLIDPAAFRYGITKPERNNCDVTLTKNDLLSAFGLGGNYKILKKNTLEPQKSLFGHLLLNRCWLSKEITIQMLIGNELFKTSFLRK